MTHKAKLRSGFGAAALAAVAALLIAGLAAGGNAPDGAFRSLGEIGLPNPNTEGKMSVEEALASRRSIRKFVHHPMAISVISQIVWATQGLSDTTKRLRTAPSAGGTYPLETYIAVRDGHYLYVPRGHYLMRLGRRDLRSRIAEAAVEQEWIADAGMVVVLAADFERTTSKYGERGKRYVYIEVGHAAQNLLLQAEALGMAATPVGAFYEDRVKDILGMAERHTPLYIVAVGHTR